MFTLKSGSKITLKYNELAQLFVYHTRAVFCDSKNPRNKLFFINKLLIIHFEKCLVNVNKISMRV